MEPIAAQQGISPSLRPTLSLHGDLAAVLQHGRVVAGEVMQRLDGGSLLLGLGRHRVAAQAGVELPVGRRFLAKVERPPGGEVVLRVLAPEGGGSEPKLLSALRGVLAEDRPVGDLLKGLAERLRGAARESGSARLDGLAGRVEGHVFEPGSSGTELQALVARAGFHYEAALLAYALRGAVGQTAGEELQALAKKLSAEAALASSRVQGPMEPAAVAAVAERLRRELDGFLRSRRGRGGDAREIAAGLETTLARAAGDSTSAELRARLAQLVRDSGLAQLLSREQGALAGNLKALLLGALADLSEGPAREALERALAGLESEQLLNIARKESHEGWQLSIPVPDGEQWATAHLAYREDDARRAEEEGGMRRLTVSVDFSELGPIRAELGLAAEELALSIVTSREDVAERVRAGLGTLVERLETDERRVRVTVRAGTPEESGAGGAAADVRWLRDHHLLDLEG